MPVLDGFGATSEIRKMEASDQLPHLRRRPIPIIAVTANALKGERENCIAAGMNEQVTKPINSQLLLECIASFIGEIEDSKDDDNLPELLDAEGLIGRCMGDVDCAQELLSDFRSLGTDAFLAVNSAQREKDMADLQQHASRLKGASGNVGAIAVANAAKKLEEHASAKDSNGTSKSICDLERALSATLNEIDRFLSGS